MKLDELLKRLSYGPFSNLSLGTDGNGTIVAGKIPNIIANINDGLLRLASRFVLNESEVIIKQSEARTIYTISSANSLITNPATGFIVDSVDNPYANDLLKILSVFDDEGTEVALNQDGNPSSVFTPKPNVLQVPDPKQDEHLHIMYQARLPHIAYNAVAATTEIDIPAVLEQPLIHYVAYMVYDAMNGQEHAAKAERQLGLYDSLCLEVIDRDMVASSQSMSNSKLEERGFI